MSESYNDSEFIDFSFCSPSPSNDECLSPEQLFEPYTSWFPGAEPESVASGSSHQNHFPLTSRLSSLEPDCQFFSTLQSLDSQATAVWVKDLLGSSGLFAPGPLASEVVQNIPDPEPIDHLIPIEDTFPADSDVKEYTEEEPNGSILEDADAVMYPKPVKGRNLKTLNSDFAVASGSGRSANLTPAMVVSPSAGSLHSDSEYSGSVSNSSALENSSLSPKARRNKKKKPTFEFVSESEWEPIHESYSRRTVNGTSRFRCTHCVNTGVNPPHYSNRVWDMLRHFQTEDHTEKKFYCANSGCDSSFTRKDSKKRHEKGCRRGSPKYGTFSAVA